MTDQPIVYLRTCGGVIGYHLDHLNDRIDEYNRSSFLVSQNCFWEWLSYVEDDILYGIDGIWNKSTAKIHYIRRPSDER